MVRHGVEEYAIHVKKHGLRGESLEAVLLQILVC